MIVACLLLFQIWYKEEMQSVPIKISKICMHLLRKLVTPSHLSFYQWNFVFTIEECFLSHFSLKQTFTTSHSQKATWGCRVLFCHVFVMPKKSSHTKNCFCHRLNNKVKHYLCNLEYCQTQRIYMQGGQMLHTLYRVFFLTVCLVCNFFSLHALLVLKLHTCGQEMWSLSGKSN